MNTYYQVSASPHTRSRLSTGRVMADVVIALVPASVMGVVNYGYRAAVVILLSIASAVLTEFIFGKIAKTGLTIRDGSAAVTGLLLALCLSPSVPWYIPVLGGIFAILFVKCFFGGLGKNFMNPALAARCFLLISFSSAMTNFSLTPDAVSSATPIAELMAGRPVDLFSMFIGSANGVIGSSVAGLLIGAIYLLVIRGISWEIPAATFGAFVLFLAIFGGRGFDPAFLLANILGGGIVMGAFFMATDPVTSPATPLGQAVYGGLIGLLMGIFRVFATATDSASYSIIIMNLVTPFIDEYIVAKPYGFRKQKAAGEKTGLRPKMFKPAVNLFVITLLAGLGLAAVFNLTRETIAEQELKAKMESYMAVLPEAVEIVYDDDLTAAVESVKGSVYGTDFGRAYINEAATGVDASGNLVGYVVSATSADGFEGKITLSVGVGADGVIKGIAFTELNETAGMGMRCDEPEFKDQFTGVSVSRFKLNKAGGSTADDEIDSVSGASVSSGAVVNAVNAALDFLSKNIG